MMPETFTCPHGDETCPCPDGADCHYEGSDAFVCKGRSSPHCHVEGCSWDPTDQRGGGYGFCGLAKMGVNTTLLSDSLVSLGMPRFGCGANRWMRHMNHKEINDWMLRGITPIRRGGEVTPSE